MCDSRRAYTSDTANPTTAITAATRTAAANPIAWATSDATPAAPAATGRTRKQADKQRRTKRRGNHVPRVEQCRSVRMFSGRQRLQAGRLRGLNTKPTPAYTTTVSATTTPMFMLAAVIEMAVCPTAIRQSRPAAAAMRHGRPSRVRPQSRSQRCSNCRQNEQARNKRGHAVCALKIERQQTLIENVVIIDTTTSKHAGQKRTLAMGRTLSTGCSSLS